jgi:hypothetical protein
MSFVNKRQEGPRPNGAPPQQQQIHVNRNAVDTASRSTSGMINKMTDQIVRDVARAIEKKQK